MTPGLRKGLLVRRPRPRPLESRDGYLIRAASANGYSTPALAFMGASVMQGVAGPKTPSKRDLFESAISALGLSQEEAGALGWPGEGRERPASKVQIGVAWFDPQDVLFGTQRLCPQCVREDGHISRLGEVRAYEFCHRHHQGLVVDCIVCGERLAASRGQMLGCLKCDVTSVDEVARPQANDLESAFSAAIAAGIVGAPLDASFVGRYGPLFHAGIGEAVRAVTIAQYTVGDDAASVATALQCFEDWPQSWMNRLDSKVDTQLCKYRSGLLGLLRREIQFLSEAGAPPFMRRVFGEWIQLRHPVIAHVPALAPIVGDDLPQDLPLTAAQAALRLGVSVRTVSAWGEQGVLERITGVLGRNERYLYPAAAVAALGHWRAERLSVVDVAKVLRVSTRTVRRLAARGLLELTEVPGTDERFIAKCQLDRFLYEIADKASGSSGPGSISLAAVTALLGPRAGERAEILRRIVAGTLVATGFSRERGIGSLRFAPDQFLPSNSGVGGPSSATHFTRGELAEYLEVCASRVSDLVSSGILPAVGEAEQRGPRARVVPVPAAARFKGEYISLNEVATSRGVSKCEARRELAQAGLRPARFAACNGLRAFYSRPQVADAHLISSAPTPEVAPPP